MTSKPVALGLTLCDYVIVEERTKKISVIGKFRTINANRFPALVQPFSVYALLTDGLGTGKLRVVINRLDTDQEIYVQEGELIFPDRLTEMRVHFRVNRCIIPAAGWYSCVLLVDGNWTAQCRIQVGKVEELS